ncbi:hypothetical protein BBJ28_00003098 [Nothophytophthora sp. Chile5]|nr:hypothetical protein BBJ28_00003098 [Nothophytophthora sp. Chile5]
MSHSGRDSPQLPESRGRRALTLDGADDRGQYDAGHDAPEAQGDEEEEEENDSMSTDGEEHAYRRGRQAIPMESPGDDLIGDLLIDDDDDMVLASGGQHLPRLRGRRGFFQADMGSDGAPRSFRYRSSGGMLQRITFRRRKRGEHDVFWTAILVCTLLSFALMSCMVIYLTQTDFFASHQNDLFGTTVDNRFTVVSQQDAQIFLKSGRYLPLPCNLRGYYCGN